MCVKEPEVPVKVTVAFELAAVAVTLRVSCCAVPGVSVTFAGDTVTPAGTPDNLGGDLRSEAVCRTRGQAHCY